jgi:predicted ABC-type ATPase
VPTPPQAIIISGPNGSGKSTAATRLLTPTTTFVNADMIAQELTGLPGTSADINAGRVLLDKVDRLVAQREDFAFETTLASKMLGARLENWRAAGYQVHLVFFWLPSADLAVQRVAARVAAGGHHVPEETIRRRFASGLRHFFHRYRPFVDTWRLYDNSTTAPHLIARGSADGGLKVEMPAIWNKLCAEQGLME